MTGPAAGRIGRSRDDSNTFEELDQNETVELSKQTRINAYEMAWDEFVGHDRDVSDIRVSDAYVDGDDVVVEVAGDVTKRDPKEIPVFQSQERWESHTETTESTMLTWVGKIAPPITTLGVATLGIFVARHIMSQLEMTVNGKPLTPPPWIGLVLMVLTIGTVIFGIQALPRMFRGGRA
jgi:hypothetical protein